ncbi:unnamed protein product [Auanema sp. JU1783]|nr:unnamed protein product [Auanema sp. JU1783]
MTSCYLKQRPQIFNPPDIIEDQFVFNSKRLPPTQLTNERFMSHEYCNDTIRYQPRQYLYNPKKAQKTKSASDVRFKMDKMYCRRAVSLESTVIPSYSRKVFVGGLPTDVPRHYVERMFQQFGDVMVDWPRAASHYKAGRNTTPCTLNGYVFLVYENEESVSRLINTCISEPNDNHYWLRMESPTLFIKAAQVRPWALSNINYVPYPAIQIDPRRTVFVGGVPRPATAKELAQILEAHFGTVVYAGVDIDPELRYPKGAARVNFATYESYIKAINGRFVKMEKMETSKREVEIKPYVMDDMMCDECFGSRNGNEFAAYFCGHKPCRQYYCQRCWDLMHTGNRADHRPCVRQGDQTKELSELPHHSSKTSQINTDLLLKMLCASSNKPLLSPWGISLV